MTRLDPAPGRQRERIVGGVIVLVGVAVLVLSIVALVSAAGGMQSDVSGPTVKLPGGSSSGTPRGATSGSSGSSSASSGSASATSSPSGASSSPTASPSRSGTGATQPLVVLNDTRTTGLAQQAAATFRQAGWTVTSTANIQQDVLSTCAYYDPAVAGAQAAAQALMAQFPAIKRVKEKFGALPAGPVVVVLTSDYTAQ